MFASYFHILKELIAIKSISVDIRYVDQMEKISIYLHQLLQQHNFSSEIIHGYGNPIVFGKFFQDRKLPTILIYGHYDTQFADNSQGRIYDPFSLYITKERIYGRGVADNKGQFLIHLLTVFDLIKQKKLGYNIMVILEGNEEIGSQFFEQFLIDYHSHIYADICLISDSHTINAMPCIDLGCRGGINMKLTLITALTDIHSGMYGGIVPNPIHEMNILFSKLYDTQHRITIPYFYYDVEEVPFDILVKNRRINIDIQKFMKNTGIKRLINDKNIDILTQIGLKPTIQITGILGGSSGNGYKNSIPNSACAYINIRIVQNQTTKKIIGAFEQRLKTTLPEYVDYTLDIIDAYEPIKLDSTIPFFKKAEVILEYLYGQPVFYKYSGSGLLVVHFLEKIFGIKSLLIPLANEDCNIHSINENLTLDAIEKGFQFSYNFFSK